MNNINNTIGKNRSYADTYTVVDYVGGEFESPTEEKFSDLTTLLMGYDQLAVAFSGGVDSTLLLLCAQEVLGPALVAVTASAPNISTREVEFTKKFCIDHEISHLVINLDPEFMRLIAANTEERCYLCKLGIFSEMLAGVGELGITHLVDGGNADDDEAFRPGMKALKELGVASPMRDVGLTKEEIREELELRDFEFWDKPSNSCLATRIPTGEIITSEKLRLVELAEDAVRGFGFDDIRVRLHEANEIDEHYESGSTPIFNATVETPDRISRESREEIRGILDALGIEKVNFSCRK